MGVLISVAMAWGVSRVVARPIRQIARAMEHIASGDADLTQSLNAEGKDEVALLARSFNTFVDKARQSSEEERALSKLLRLSLSPTATDVYLNQVLGLLIDNVTWLGLLPKGGIFVSDVGRERTLRLTASRNFSPELVKLCDTVSYGQCLCGRAAASGRIEFAGCLDERHDIRFEGIQPHGHYSVPIRSGSSVSGVLVLYMPEGHGRLASEEEFLNRVAEVLSMGISLRQANAGLLAAKQQAEAVSDRLTGITANIPGIIFQYCLGPDGERVYPYVSAGTTSLLGAAGNEAQSSIKQLFGNVHPHDKERVEQAMRRSPGELQSINVECRIMQQGGGIRWILCTAVPRSHADGSVLWDGLLLDITDRKNLESQLLQAQKLESIGQLAAGIAHEINTPTQYVQDNTHFLQQAFEDYQAALVAVQRLRAQRSDAVDDARLVAEVDRVIEKADIEYLAEEIPRAIRQSLEGLQRIASIVSAMKEFSHPGSEAKQPVDINAVIRNVVTVSKNEWKYVADLDTDLESALPSPPGHRDKLGQVILNLIVNAAQAIGEKVATEHGGKGRIVVKTAKVGESVEIRISDNGPGIPESIQQKIFDPFFTTKPVGKGTGQGLSIAHSVVVDKHGGTFTLESTPGHGATFVIRLPLEQHRGDGAVAA